MKLKKLAGLTVAAVAAAGFAMVSTSAVAATKHTTSTKNVKCTGVTTKSGKGYVMVSKSACDELGGTAKSEGTTKAKSKTKMTKTTTTTSTTNETATPAAQPQTQPGAAPAMGATPDNTATTPNQ